MARVHSPCGLHVRQVGMEQGMRGARLDAVGGREELERGLAVHGHDAREQFPIQAAPVCMQPS